MHRRRLIALAGGLLVTMSVSFAHHGGGVEWQQHVTGPVTGVATEFSFTFPHVVVYVDVDGENGPLRLGITTRWTPTILRRAGWSRKSIQPGDTVSFTYAPHVSDPTVGQMRSIEVNGKALPLQF